MADLITATCAACAHSVRVPLSYSGRRAKCPKCQGVIQIPAPEAPPAEPDPFAPFPDEPPPPPPADSDQTRISAPTWDEADPGAAEPAPAPAAAGRRSSHGGTGVRGRKSSLIAAAANKPDSKAPVIITVVLLVVGLGALGAALFGHFSKKARPAATAGPSADPSADPGATPVPGDPAALAKAEIESRTRDWIAAFNTNDPRNLEPFYAMSQRELNQALDSFFSNHTWSLEKVELVEVTPGGETAYVKLKYDRVKIERLSKFRSEEPGRERLLNWKKVDGRWVLNGPPEP